MREMHTHHGKREDRVGGQDLKQGIYEVTYNEKIAKDIYKMILTGDTAPISAPGQFVNIKLDGFFLRRPISVCRYDERSITIVYKVVGGGTEYMSTLSAGARLDMLTGLGNGFDTKKSGDSPVVIGGGVGAPPLLGLAEALIKEGKKVTAVLGFNTRDDVCLACEFASLGANVMITTVDGSVGTKGFVTDALHDLDYSYFYTCGPLPMLKAVYACTKTDGEFSFEERMGCGFGACMGCSCKTKYGYKRICRDGPVLEKGEIVW